MVYTPPFQTSNPCFANNISLEPSGWLMNGTNASKMMNGTYAVQWKDLHTTTASPTTFFLRALTLMPVPLQEFPRR